MSSALRRRDRADHVAVEVTDLDDHAAGRRVLVEVQLAILGPQLGRTRGRGADGVAHLDGRRVGQRPTLRARAGAGVSVLRRARSSEKPGVDGVDAPPEGVPRPMG